MNPWIEFRGKRKDNRKWEYGDLVQARHNRAFILAQTAAVKAVNAVNIEVDSATVGQYTGRTDTKGCKIFEGDRVHDPDSKEGEYTVARRGSAFVLQGNPGFGFRYLHECDKPTIVGNIHDKEPGVYWAKTDTDHDWEVVEVITSLGEQHVLLIGNDSAFPLSTIVEWGDKIAKPEEGLE